MCWGKWNCRPWPTSRLRILGMCMHRFSAYHLGAKWRVNGPSTDAWCLISRRRELRGMLKTRSADQQTKTTARRRRLFEWFITGRSLPDPPDQSTTFPVVPCDTSSLVATSASLPRWGVCQTLRSRCLLLLWVECWLGSLRWACSPGLPLRSLLQLQEKKCRKNKMSFTEDSIIEAT